MVGKRQNTSVWNPLAPSNISKIDKQVDDWVDNYKNFLLSPIKVRSQMNLNTLNLITNYQN